MDEHGNIIHPEAVIADDVDIGRFNVVGAGVRLSEGCSVGFFNVIGAHATFGARTRIGDHCIFGEGAQVGDDCAFTAYCEIRRRVRIGHRTTFGTRCTVSAGGVIGQDVLVKGGFILTDTPKLTRPRDKHPGDVGNRALIGANVWLMPGYTIGTGAVIGACSQVRSHVPAGQVWFGNPAAFMRERRDDE